MKRDYKIFGYYVESEMELNAYEAVFDEPDVTIKIGKVNSQLQALENWGWYFSNEDKNAGFRVPQIGAYEVVGGKSIIITPDKGVSDSEIQLFLLGFAFGFLMQQRGVFPLHGSTVDMGTSCLTLVGYSGSGKTSLASGFVERGFRLLTDDVSRIGPIEGVHHVYPSYPSQKIWRDALTYMKIDYDPEKCIANRTDKFYVNDRRRFSACARPIEAVVEIHPADVNKPSLIRLEKRDALKIMLTHSYCREMMGPKTDLSGHFQFCSQLAMAVPVYRLLRPYEGFTVREQVDILIEHFWDII